MFLSGVVPVLFAAILAVYRPPAIARLDDAAYDIVVRSAGARQPANRVVIVDVDERSLAAVGQWPWRRDVMGRLISSLRAAGPSAIAIDVIFAESDRYTGGGSAPRTAGAEDPDLQFAAILRDSGVVLGYGLTFDPGGVSNRQCVIHPVALAIVQPPGDDIADPFFRATGAVCDLPELAKAAARSGFLNAAPDADGILRRVPLLAEFDGKVYPSLALSAVAAATGAGSPTLKVSTVNASMLSLGNIDVPVDGKSNLLLGFRGRKRTFPYVSAADVLSGAIPADSLRWKIVLVGTTALGTREVVATPLDTQFVGVEVQATTVDNLLQRDFVHRSVLGTSLDTLIVVLAGAAVAALVAGSGVTAGLAGAAILLAAFWWGAAWLLSSPQRLFVSPLPPTFTVVVTLAVMTLARFMVER